MKNGRVASCELRVARQTRARGFLATRNSQLATSPRGFTLIEILTVIGIIVLLASMLFMAYNYVGTSSKIRDTKTALQTARTLFDNYKQATHLTKPLADLSTNANQTVTVIWPASNTPIATWTPPPSANLAAYWSVGYESGNVPMGETAPGEISIGMLTAFVTGKPPNNIYQYPYPATDPVKNLILLPNALPQQLVDTICVMYTIEQLPDNKAIIANLPSQRVLTLPLVIATSTTTSQTSVALLLDGWGNPILFVPAIGLYGVETNSAVNNWSGGQTYSQGDQVIYSFTDSNNVVHYYLNTWVSPSAGSGTGPPGPPPPSPSATNNPWGGLCAPGLRHYWVSGGPDGNVSTHDDNIYSFQD